MPAVQVRDLPQETYDLLKAEAHANRRSINKQTEVILVDFFANRGVAETHSEQTVETTSSSPRKSTAPTFCASTADEVALRSARRRALFSRIDAATPINLPDELNAATVIRQMRDER